VGNLLALSAKAAVAYRISARIAIPAATAKVGDPGTRRYPTHRL
jgi:hypothetical protein